MKPPVRALIFDVFGTLVDWHGSIAREVGQFLSGRVSDPHQFARDWRAQYQPSMEAVRSGALPFSKLDVLHRHNLDRVLSDRGLHDVDGDLRTQLVMAWHRLDAWPDVTPALSRLHTRFRLAPCSNGNISLMVDLARHHGWHWDAILGAELARDYKPKPAVYRCAADARGLRPDEVLMVAAHSSDLAAAAACGLRTAHVVRLDEYGPATGEPRAEGPVDHQADDLLKLAQQLGA